MFKLDLETAEEPEITLPTSVQSQKKQENSRKISTSASFPGGSESKASACNVGDPGLIPGSGRSPGKGNGNPLQYSCLGNLMRRRDWQATVHGIAEELDTT